MATINATLPTLQDLVSRMDPNGAVANVVEILTQQNAFLQDMVFKEGNLPTGHMFTSRKALPSGTWRRFNQGVAPSKSRTDQITETCGKLAAMSKIDCSLAKLNGNEAAFRASEDRAFVQGLSNDMETAIIYSSLASTPEQIQGFAPRLASTSGLWGGQVLITTNGTGIATSGSDQSSVWLVCWGPDTVYGIYPKGSTGGLKMEDGGKQLTRDSGGTNEFWAYVSSWEWDIGLCVQDYRNLVRLANIDTSAIVGTGKLLIEGMVKATKQCFDLKRGRPVFYANRKIEAYLHLQALDSTVNSTLRVEAIGGAPITTFLGIPVKTSDAITNAEAIIT